MISPGAFSAIAVSGASEHRGLRFRAASFALPGGVLVHEGHDWQSGQPLDRPVGIAVPRLVGEQLVVDGVFASTATGAWNKVRHGINVAVSIVSEGDADLDWSLAPGGGIEAAGWVLVAVDLVHAGEDPGAGIMSWRSDLNPAEAAVQQHLDRFLGDESAPLGVDLLDGVRRAGVAALEPLRSLVEPVLAAKVTA